MKLLKPGCLILLLFLSACGLAQLVTVPVPVDYTAKITFSRDSTTILIINQFDSNTLNISNKKKLDVFTAGAFTAARTAENSFNTLRHVKVINMVDSVAFKVNPDSVKTLALKYHADYVLVLKNFAAKIGLTEVAGGTAYYDINAEVDFMLYESNGLFYKKLKGTVDDPQSDRPDVGLLGNLLIHPTVKGNKSAFTSAATHAAQNALQDYFPYTITHDRPLYNDDYLKPAVKQILAGNLNKADSLLTPLTHDVNPEIAGKSAYNLAVVYEAKGNIEGAIDMAQQSSDKKKSDYATAILADLKQE
ncbi:DUF6340 family protein [Mucilaginibacter sp.]|uniref:DUF6340 family protein n=1 Tax=Mucilaginibacter sp. TaxID=1882438 RepID=UPI003D0DD0ED